MLLVPFLVPLSAPSVSGMVGERNVGNFGAACRVDGGERDGYGPPARYRRIIEGR